MSWKLSCFGGEGMWDWVRNALEEKEYSTWGWLQLLALGNFLWLNMMLKSLTWMHRALFLHLKVCFFFFNFPLFLFESMVQNYPMVEKQTVLQMMLRWDRIFVFWNLEEGAKTARWEKFRDSARHHNSQLESLRLGKSVPWGNGISSGGITAQIRPYLVSCVTECSRNESWTEVSAGA